MHYLLICLAVSLLTAGVTAGQTAEGNETQITMDESDQNEPAIYGDTIVWTDYRNVNLTDDIGNLPVQDFFKLDADIYAYNISTGEVLQGQYELLQNIPDIYGDRVVWEDYRNATLPEDGNNLTTEDWLRLDVNIYMHNLSSGEDMQITANESIQWSPAIDGDLIVWEDARNGNWDIYVYDLSTGEEMQVTGYGSSQMNPAVSGDGLVVWEDSRNGNWDIYMYNMSSGEEIQLTSNGSDQIAPAIYGNIIVWEDYRNADQAYGNMALEELVQLDADIYGYDLSTGEEFLITENESWQGEPAIYGNRIVWTDLRNVEQATGGSNNTSQDSGMFDADIYMYDLSTGEELLITEDRSWQEEPEIYENRIVWTDYRNGNPDIYVFELS
ncbi:MAG: hypothetical protein SCH66_02125 [Methanolobus sp.]|nr:hypothetical protein [Methanolobus sp.]